MQTKIEPPLIPGDTHSNSTWKLNESNSLPTFSPMNWTEVTRIIAILTETNKKKSRVSKNNSKEGKSKRGETG
jgi:hypothetical protein